MPENLPISQYNKVPELTQELADNIVRIARTQWRQSRDFKQGRIKDITESESLYNGQVEKDITMVYNDSYPFMSGFVDHLLSKIDEPPTISYEHTELADYKSAQKISAAWETISASTKPNMKLSMKDRYVKKLAIFSGRGIFKIYAERDSFKVHIDAIDYHHFHCEPAGGGHLENHLFMGQDNVYKTKGELVRGAQKGKYDNLQVKEICEGTSSSGQDYKEQTDEDSYSDNRSTSIGLDPRSNNYVGEPTFKLAEWYLTYRGVRWYCLFDLDSGMWVRIVPLREMFKPQEDTGEALWPYVSWATHEDPLVFWSKSPCDDARPVAKSINKLMNQALYNRDQINMGAKLYDPDMVLDVEALMDVRPDNLVPVKTSQSKGLGDAVFQFERGELSGTIDMVQFIDSYSGQKTGSTPSSQGVAEKNKKVGIFFGELEQIEDRLGLYNKSYKEAWAEIGQRFVDLLDEYMDEPMAIKILGSEGIEWSEITKKDLKRNRDFDLKITGGTEEQELNELEKRQKIEVLKNLQTVNPEWRERQLMETVFSEDEIKAAFSSLPMASQELLSEAEQALQEILTGGKPRVNRGANTMFMQYILDKEAELDLGEKKMSEDEEADLRARIIQYALSHAEVAQANESRALQDTLRETAMKKIAGGEVDPSQIQMPQGDDMEPMSPTGAVQSGAQRATNLAQMQ